LPSPTAPWTKQTIHSQDLHEQLTVHHDTRFLATLLFTSFFFSMPAGGEFLWKGGHPAAKHCEELKDYKKMVVWDYAVAAIALAVKV
jgi:hypothetical protein